MTADLLRAKTFSDLEAIGFRPAKSLPLPDVEKPVRAAHEVAARLMALNATFAWVAFPEKSAPSDRLEKYIERNGLRDWLTEEEAEIISLPRADAQMSHVVSAGWRLENMWALAWVLGFDPEPSLEPSPVSNDVTRRLIVEFLPGLDRKAERPAVAYSTRVAGDVVAMEYRFYCAHNAVRSAQLGSDTVPDGFHPVMHGGLVHERRHALSWSIAPDVAWNETELST